VADHLSQDGGDKGGCPGVSEHPEQSFPQTKEEENVQTKNKGKYFIFPK
jgi:hypothetical protein